MMRAKGNRWLRAHTGFGSCDGACLLLAHALYHVLPGSQIVSLVRASRHRGAKHLVPVSPLDAEHYGVRWEGWYYDGLGGFSSAAEWVAYFGKPLTHGLVVVDRFVSTPAIPDGRAFRDEVVRYLRRNLPPIRVEALSWTC